MDTQTIEIIGRNLLTAELLRAGLEVALPLRDRGIDLIAYADLGDEVPQFVACPIQMKAASDRSFSIHRKYERFPGLLHAFVWNVARPDTVETYALTQAEAVAVATAMGYCDTPSWRIDGSYSSSRPSQGLLELLRPYRMSAAAWRQKVTMPITAFPTLTSPSNASRP